MEKANKLIKTVHLEITMYRKTERQLPLENFHLPFGGELDPDNRWIKLANIIPWDQFETKYAAKFTKNNMGAPAKPVRMALGALILKERCGCSDEELVEQIKENPYLQFFYRTTGVSEKSTVRPVDDGLFPQTLRCPNIAGDQ
jgi:IS5 family transposase